MKPKPILFLVFLLLLLGGTLYYFLWLPSRREVDRRPQMWSVDEEEIERIRIELPRLKKAITFSKDPQEKWRFQDPPGPEVDRNRWGGILTLVSGPKAKRAIGQGIVDFAPYGLERPTMIITLFLRGGRDPLEIHMGDPTPQGDHYYMRLRHRPTLYLMHQSYCEVLMRLVMDPPYPPAASPMEGKKE